MTHEIPKTTKQWNVSSHDGSEGFDALKFSEQEIPELGHSEVLVKRMFFVRCLVPKKGRPLI